MGPGSYGRGDAERAAALDVIPESAQHFSGIAC